jgi:hypothetical protein
MPARALRVVSVEAGMAASDGTGTMGAVKKRKKE